MKVEYDLNRQQLAKVEATLSITMSISDWEELCKAIDTRWPGWVVKDAIQSAIRKAGLTFTGTVEPR